MFVIFMLILCALTLIEIIGAIFFKIALLLVILLISVIVIYNTRPLPPKPAPAPAHGHGGSHGGGHGGHGGHAYTAVGLTDGPKKQLPIARWIFIGLAVLCLYFLMGWWLSWRDAKLYAREGAERGHTTRPLISFEDEDLGWEWTWRVYGFNRHTCRQELRILRCSPIGNCQLWEHPIDLGEEAVACTPTRAPYPKY